MRPQLKKVGVSFGQFNFFSYLCTTKEINERIMKITELEPFKFKIGNTKDDELDVVATNDGIFIDNGLDGEFDDVDIIDAHDLCNAIDDAILNCSSLSADEMDELGTYLGAYIDVEYWWEENYG